MGLAGFERTATQCRDKIKKLKSEYQKVKDHNNETGRNRKKWKFYDALNDVLGNRPTTQPSTLIDTSAEIEKPSEEPISDDDIPSESVINDDISEGSTSTSDLQSRNDSIASVSEEISEIKPVASNRKRKRSKQDKMERAVDRMCEMINQSQVESDKIFASLEEKRMQFDMQILQMEQDRRREEAERAEKQKKEDREFQLRLFSMIYSSNTGSPFPPSPSFYYNNPQQSHNTEMWHHDKTM